MKMKYTNSIYLTIITFMAFFGMFVLMSNQHKLNQCESTLPKTQHCKIIAVAVTEK